MGMRKEKGDLALLGEIEKRLEALPPLLLGVAAIAASSSGAIEPGGPDCRPVENTRFTADDVSTLRQVVERLDKLSPEAAALAAKRIEARMPCTLLLVNHEQKGADVCTLPDCDPDTSGALKPYPPSEEV